METLIFGKSSTFKKIMEIADQYAKSDFPVLVLGETGVGKELIAKRVHAVSKRHASPFVPVNCGAIPTGLFESELFGFERGAFSGASQSHRGLIRQAMGGTLFLDEIGEMDPLVQVKLLRFLDSGEVRALGNAKAEVCDVRLIAATNVDLDQAVADGRFRKDLLERLSVLTLRILPLRERPQDITALALHHIRSLGTDMDPDAIELLATYHWPGNIRQLKNFLIRASTRCKHGRILPGLVEELLEEERARERVIRARPQLEGSLAEIEKQVIVDRLYRYNGNRKETARDLGIAKSTLHEKLKRWNKSHAEDFADAVVSVSYRS